MTHPSTPSEQIVVYFEVGKKRALAGALEWPGWCRGGRDAGGALNSLIEYGPRYERVLHAAGLPFHAPTAMSSFVVTERLAGNATTDFGAPDVAPSSDALPVDDAELRRLQDLLEACWTAFDSTVQAAYGKELRKGPRGGGRDLAEVVRHVLEAEASYLTRLGGKGPKQGDNKADEHGKQGMSEPGLLLLNQHGAFDLRQIILDTLGSAARGDIPLRGPRGGIHWTPRFFVRRAAWHVLDHVWEIEDRVI